MMEYPAEDQVIVCRCRSEQECAELALVLTASGIAHRGLFSPPGQWMLSVPAAQADRARAEIAAYRAEHAQPPPTVSPLEHFPGAWAGVGAYAAVLMLVATCTRQF